MAEVRREAVKQIAFISLPGDAATTAALVALMKDRDRDIRLQAITAIRRVGSRGQPAVVDAVLMGLRDSDLQVPHDPPRSRPPRRRRERLRGPPRRRAPPANGATAGVNGGALGRRGGRCDSRRRRRCGGCAATTRWRPCAGRAAWSTASTARHVRAPRR